MADRRESRTEPSHTPSLCLVLPHLGSYALYITLSCRSFVLARHVRSKSRYPLPSVVLARRGLKFKHGYGVYSLEIQSLEEKGLGSFFVLFYFTSFIASFPSTYLMELGMRLKW